MAGGAQSGKPSPASRQHSAARKEGRARELTAAVLVIGDEILSGQVADTNSRDIVRFLAAHGIDVREIRVVPDEVAAIVRAINDLRAAYDYVFTTGGIGPTHDDVTTEAVAQAFHVPVVEHPEAAARLRAFLRARGQRENTARMRMARVPRGAELIDNPVSAAPGFRMGNVFVLAGVPRVMRAMLQSLDGVLERGRVVHERVLQADVPEGEIGEELAQIDAAHPDVAIGSYPAFDGPADNPRMRVRIVLRAHDEAALEAAAQEVAALLARHRQPGPGK